MVDSVLLNKLFVGLIVLGVHTAAAQEFPAELVDPPPDCYSEYDHTTNTCFDSKCPNDSIGIFPNCNCTATNFNYSVLLNKCFRVCPDDSICYWPNCECTGEAGFDKESFQCKECPSDTVRGTFPNCVCEDANSRFNAHRNYCETCPIGSSGTIPNCICDDGAGEFKMFNN